MSATVLCVNPTCAKPVGEGVRYCPFCRTEQEEIEPLSESFDPGTYMDEGPSFVAPATRPNSIHKNVILLRASESVWDSTDPEPPVAVGEARPLVVADEHSTHLSDTSRKLEPATLLARAQAALDAADVHINLELRRIAWVSHPGDARQRLVASLRDHDHSYVKMLLGVDYLGKWASITQQVAFEPEPFSMSYAWMLVLAGRACFLIAALIMVTVFFQSNGAMGGMDYSSQDALRHSWPQWDFFLVLVGLALIARGKAREARERAEQRARQAARMARTFAVDDMRLFCSAMQEVYQQIVDDIVQKGGEVVRVSGGGGGFFVAAGVTQAAPERRSDAASLEV